jgi:hypothetical protein
MTTVNIFTFCAASTRISSSFVELYTYGSDDKLTAEEVVAYNEFIDKYMSEFPNCRIALLERNEIGTCEVTGLQSEVFTLALISCIASENTEYIEFPAEIEDDFTPSERSLRSLIVDMVRRGLIKPDRDDITDFIETLDKYLYVPFIHI